MSRNNQDEVICLGEVFSINRYGWDYYLIFSSKDRQLIGYTKTLSDTLAWPLVVDYYVKRYYVS
jgi:hypothetical protein